MTTKQVLDLEASHILQTYRRVPVVLTRGQGVHMYDDEGREYTDLLSGIGVASLGHAHPRLAKAIRDQAETLLHTSNLYYHPLQGQLARKLADLSGLPRAFFCNSGGEAVEACLKFARRYWHTHEDAGRTEIVALEHAFHGRTFGALSVTWNEPYRAPFQPLVPGVRFVPANPDAIAAALSPATQAIIVEPVQGEGGIRPLSPECARAIGEGCARSGALLIADEVQCGLGRTGHAFYYQALGLHPHLVAVGKAMGGGVPIGAALSSDVVSTTITYGDHGSTYGGNLLACRAALVFLDELVKQGLLTHVGRVGAHLGNRLRALAARQPAIAEVRGLGLMWGLEVTCDAGAIVDAALAHRLLVNRTAGTVVRLLPPLTITEAEIDRAVDTLETVFTEVCAGASA